MGSPEYVPDAQSVWNHAPARHTLPFEHTTPADTPGVAQKSPARHCFAVAPVLAVPTQLPAVHAPEHVGTERLPALPNVPAGQGVAAPAPGGQKLPVPHAEQLLAVAAAKLPAVQSVGTATAAAHAEPAGHVVCALLAIQRKPQYRPAVHWFDGPDVLLSARQLPAAPAAGSAAPEHEYPTAHGCATLEPGGQ